MLAMAFVALGFVSLAPFCELAFANHGNSEFAGFVTAAGRAAAEQPDRGDAPPVACCAGVKDGTLVKVAEPLVTSTRGGSLGIMLFASIGLPLFARSRDPAKRILAAPPGLSFYARSARILR